MVDKINEFRKVVKDKSKPIEERRFALRFLIHCVEDMHMPMHVGDNHDRGGNDTQVRFFDPAPLRWACGMAGLLAA